ncbi:MAG: outer membrane lipoprotein-sorting protein [Candidatus Margulisbacteria bacterium]|nr:outer membrane lipoprotein-sorting protein [Candidatus Margulisiibacteriota bacterium]
MKIFAQIILLLSFCFALTGPEILQKVDNNFQGLNQISESTMIIHDLRFSRSISAKSWSAEKGKLAFTEYLSPAREKGTKMLKIEDELWIYSPMADRIIKIAGHMLKQSVSGSDLSYEDYLEESDLVNNYSSKIIREELFEERECYVLELVGKKEGLSYPVQKIWVDKERFLPLKSEQFAKSGELLKRSVINEVFKVANRWYPKRMTYKDMLKTGKGTEFVVDSIKFDQSIPAHTFTKANLRR